ncbi:MAG: hypothetical protein LBR51_02255 [Bacteroidales bacterium]|nr:hypothetical protein [Bacteroidales bacterium]
MMYPKSIQWSYDILDSFWSVVRLLKESRFVRVKKINREHESCIIMGNGPSLSNTLKANADNLQHHDLIAVNFAALADEFLLYKPNTYVLCDPAFWFQPDSEDPESSLQKVNRFYRHLAENVTWNMQLFIPFQAKKIVTEMNVLSRNPRVSVCYFNRTKIEGFKCLKHAMLKRQWGMFRTQNVIVAALLLAIYSNYKDVYLAGLDFDWTKNLRVDENNDVCFSDNHFYAKTDRKMSQAMYETYYSLYCAHASFYNIKNYAETAGVNIFNLNKQSFVNCFEKKDKIL